jgi:hypothetical protein
MPKNRSHTHSVCRTTGKRMFRDNIAAALALEAIQLRARRTIHDESRYYTCKFCDHVHLTSQDQRTELQGMKHSA